MKVEETCVTRVIEEGMYSRNFFFRPAFTIPQHALLTKATPRWNSVYNGKWKAIKYLFTYRSRRTCIHIKYTCDWTRDSYIRFLFTGEIFFFDNYLPFVSFRKRRQRRNENK